MIVLIAILIVLITYTLWMRRDIYKLSWQLPGPFAPPIIGNAFVAHPNRLLSNFDRLSKTYESPFRIWFGPLLAVFIADAENVEIILKSKDCFNKPDAFYKMMRDGIGADGLITSKEEEWKAHRKLIGPTINQHTLNKHLPIFNRHIRETVSNLPTDGKFFDILKYISKCKLAMFVEASLGAELDPELRQRFQDHLPEGIEIVGERTLQPLYHIDFIWNMTKAAKHLKMSRQEGQDELKKIVQIKSDTGDNSGSLLGKLVEVSKNNPKFTLDDVLGETITILVGAADTSSISFAFMALMLAMHPEYQEKCFQEIYEMMPDKNVDLSHSDLEKLNFTDLCVRETLRLFPIAPLICREAKKPIKLSNNVVVPVGVPMIFGLRQIHLQEKYYGPTAGIFNPYRFLDEKIKNLPASAYVPFSYGPRNCIGIHYAETAVKCFTAHLIRSYRLTTSYTSIDQLEIVHKITLKLGGKHMVAVEPRTI